MPGVFDGEHELRVLAGTEGGARFVQREVFSGLLVPLMGKVLDDTETGFAAMNAALRERAVARAAGPAPA